eukprot:jgi/Tetstr1/458655/TSEL_045048.t1
MPPPAESPHGQDVVSARVCASAARGLAARHHSGVATLPVWNEVEIKLRLPDAQAYAAVAQALEPGWRQDHWLEDQYFDGPNGELDAGLVALRCRIYDVDRRAVLALKGKPVMSDGVGRADEIEENVDPALARTFPHEPRALATLDSKLMSMCRSKYGLRNGLVSLGGFKNFRREFEWGDGKQLLELDLTTFEHGQMYELEVETAEPHVVQPKLEEFLHARSIPFTYSTVTKFANFRNRTLQ